MSRKQIEGRVFELSDGSIDECLRVARKLLLRHREQIEKSVNESEDKQLPIHITVTADASQSADSFPVGIRFNIGTVTDKIIVRGDPAGQSVFSEFTAAELDKLNAEEKKAAEESRQAASGVPEPKKRGRKPKAAPAAETPEDSN
jgi:hypothetical protein